MYYDVVSVFRWEVEVINVCLDLVEIIVTWFYEILFFIGIRVLVDNLICYFIIVFSFGVGLIYLRVNIRSWSFVFVLVLVIYNNKLETTFVGEWF